MATFRSVENMRKVVSSGKSDLRQLRGINDKLQAQLGAINKPAQYSTEYIRAESARLRAEAKELSRAYLAGEKTMEQLADVKAQAAQWTPERFLASQANDTVNDTNALLKKNNLLLTTQRMTTARLADLAQAASDKGDFATLGTIHSEAEYRKQQGDEAAGVLLVGIASVQIPALAEAKTLAGEAAMLADYVSFTVKAIETGSPDLGAQNERWHAQAEARRAAQHTP
jgi:hypothetical protein